MSTVYSRLGYNFNTARFGAAANLNPAAVNTMITIATNTPPVANWAISDLANGNISTANYLQNPTANNIANMLVSTNLIVNYAVAANGNNYSDLANTANALILTLNAFKSHTDNISGVTVTTNPNVPSYSTAMAIGQQNFMILSKTDGTSTLQDTTPILGSFTCLFISDILQANTIKLSYYAGEMANGNVSNAEIASINSYCVNTSTALYNQIHADWTFYQNSVQLSKDYGFLQQFSNMGSTNKYLVNNVIGTAGFVTKLNS